VRGFEPEISDLLSPPLSSLGGGEGENKDSFKMRTFALRGPGAAAIVWL
jgi:hypothetical protein